MALEASNPTQKEMPAVSKVEDLELKLASCNEKILAEKENKNPPRYSEHYDGLVGVFVELTEEYRKQKDFDKEMQLYDDQQALFSQYHDDREFVPWEMYKGGCCGYYEKKEDAIRYLENAFRLSEAAWKIYRWRANELNTVRPPWSMHYMPTYGKALCRFYIEADRHEEAVGVASICYAYVRNAIVDHTPILQAFEPALYNWVHWTEICGNIYVECDQKYMARQIYNMTVMDLKRFNWDSPLTWMTKDSQTHFSDIFKRKLENLGPDSDDEQDSDEDAEPPIPFQRRLKLVFLQPSVDFAARIECTTSVVDIAKAPAYKALSYAWGGSPKVISYSREDGPPYAAEEDNDKSNLAREMVMVDGQAMRIRQTLFHALQQIREPNTAVAIWVDAIGINPKEMERRAALTLRMRDIYKYAEEVIVWLGQGDEETQEGMDFLDGFWEERPKLQRNSELGEYFFGPLARVPWEGICKLLQMPWWKRIWTLQEFVVAKELQIRCGDKRIPWRDLQDFTWFVVLESTSFPLSEKRHDILRPRIELIKAKNEFICLQEEYRMEYGFPLEKLWQVTKTHESYDPRDKIFALLGMLDKPSFKYAPKINYDFCPCSVYTDMILFRSIENSLDDAPMAKSQRAGNETLLGLEKSEEGGEESLFHIYPFESQRLKAKCDGEKCGRRIKCFTDGGPEFPEHWSFPRIMEHMEMCYDAYLDMKKTDRFVEILRLGVTENEEVGDGKTIEELDDEE